MTPDEHPQQGQPNQPPDTPGRSPSTPDRGETATATQTPTKPRPAPPRLDRLPPYRVLLHNDDVNDGLDVVDTLVELTPLNRQRATLVMLEADATGVALVLVTHKERAELYRDQFRAKLLTVTIEPAE
ncbi:MAG: ATP-dependent Clp protease adaptor ClpS [Phycisphaerales bacterium]|nr:ATP-dependent Clp protease adaptor ClpS [Phycisphaerales bacterium]